MKNCTQEKQGNKCYKCHSCLETNLGNSLKEHEQNLSLGSNSDFAICASVCLEKEGTKWVKLIIIIACSCNVFSKGIQQNEESSSTMVCEIADKRGSESKSKFRTQACWKSHEFHNLRASVLIVLTM